MGTRLLFRALVACIILNHAGAHAENTEWKKGNNAFALPQYCKDRLDPDGAWQKWRAHFGVVYIHMHHYCGGLYAEFKARLIVNKRERAKWLQEVVVQMRYVGRHCDRGCVIYKELHQRWAWALGELGKPVEAMQHLREAGLL
jgi:hypothetical protein